MLYRNRPSRPKFALFSSLFFSRTPEDSYVTGKNAFLPLRLEPVAFSGTIPADVIVMFQVFLTLAYPQTILVPMPRILSPVVPLAHAMKECRHADRLFPCEASSQRRSSGPVSPPPPILPPRSQMRFSPLEVSCLFLLEDSDEFPAPCRTSDSRSDVPNFPSSKLIIFSTPYFRFDSAREKLFTFFCCACSPAAFLSSPLHWDN